MDNSEPSQIGRWQNLITHTVNLETVTIQITPRFVTPATTAAAGYTTAAAGTTTAGAALCKRIGGKQDAKSPECEAASWSRDACLKVAGGGDCFWTPDVRTSAAAAATTAAAGYTTAAAGVTTAAAGLNTTAAAASASFGTYGG